jgi:hypothetical protein
LAKQNIYKPLNYSFNGKMYWKLTKAKTLVSLIIGILLFFWGSPILSGGFNVFSIIGPPIGFGLVYLIWSLIQKKTELQQKVPATETTTTENLINKIEKK